MVAFLSFWILRSCVFIIFLNLLLSRQGFEMHRSLLSINGKFSPFLMFSKPARGSIDEASEKQAEHLANGGRVWEGGGGRR